MEIQFKIDENKKGSFFIENDNGDQIAELEFEIENNILDAHHTGVRKELEGQGIAAKLFDKMIEYAQNNNYMVKPTCPYIEMKFKRAQPKLNDIWFQDNK